MDFKSIQWQLPLSYGAVAFLGAIALGAIMLWQLNNYYINLERENLGQNAKMVQDALRFVDIDKLPKEVLQAQVDSFAFFTRSQVQLSDLNQKLILESENQAELTNIFRYSSLPSELFENVLNTGAGDILLVETGVLPSSNWAPILESDVIKTPNNMDIATSVVGSLPLLLPHEAQSPEFFNSGEIFITGNNGNISVPVVSFSFLSAFDAVEQPVDLDINYASKESVQVPLHNMYGEQVGTIILSGGPAYGRQITKKVAQAWGVAGTLSVFVAALAGWVISRRVSSPLTILNKATNRMAAGDLTYRVCTEKNTIREFLDLGKAFNHMANQIEMTVKILRQFAVDAAHELKTPLTALRTNLELIQTEKDVKKIQIYASRAEGKILHLEKLMNGLLDLSRLETGSEIRMETININLLLMNRSEYFAAQAEQANVDYQLAIPEKPLYVLGEMDGLQQALDNLLENAIKFTPQGGLVRVSLVELKDNISIQIQDNGIGFSEIDHTRLFNRFYRGKNTGSFPGSGLGLAITKIIVDSHQGNLIAENLPSGGAKFTILLPKRLE